jgi:hypothetical protein
VETSTVESLQFVAEIDVIKARMEKSCACLEESRLVLETAARLEQSLTAAESSDTLLPPTACLGANASASSARSGGGAVSRSMYLPEGISEVDAEILRALQQHIDLALVVDAHQPSGSRHTSSSARNVGPATPPSGALCGAVSDAALERAARVCEQVALVRDGLRGAASMVPALSATSESLRDLQRRAYRVVAPLLARSLAAGDAKGARRSRDLMELIERPDAYRRWCGWVRGAPLRRWWRTRALIKESSDLHRWVWEWYGKLAECYELEVGWLALDDRTLANQDGYALLHALLSATAGHHAVLLERLALLNLVEAHRHTVQFVDQSLLEAMTTRSADHLAVLRRLALRPYLPYVLRYAQLEYRYLTDTVLASIKSSFKRADHHSELFARQRRNSAAQLPSSSSSSSASSSSSSSSPSSTSATEQADSDTQLLEAFERDVRAVQESAAPLLLALEEAVDRFVGLTRGTQTLSFLTCLSVSVWLLVAGGWWSRAPVACFCHKRRWCGRRWCVDTCAGLFSCSHTHSRVLCVRARRTSWRTT